MAQPPKGNFIPPRDRPKWLGDESGDNDLIYLGWGRRYHGNDPSPPYRHAGWLYIMLTAGDPTYLINGARKRATPRSLIIIDPECSFGVTDVKGAISSWLLWIWKDPPSGGLVVPPKGYCLFNLSARDMKDLLEVHDCCRAEVAAIDAYTSDALRLQHRLLDIRIRRLSDVPSNRVDEAHLLQMGLNWLRLNMSTRQPVSLLCEYLQISPAALTKLFGHYLRTSPARYHQRSRMEWAKKELSKNCSSVKAVAYELGFQHPGDFTRAYQKFHRTLPKKVRAL